MQSVTRCPNCLSNDFTVEADCITCKCCGLAGNLKDMQFCKKVPVFQPVKEELLYTIREQLYKHKDTWFTLSGYVEGCGRPVTGGYCRQCRYFLPELAEAKTRRGKSVVREDVKSAAAGDG